MDRICIACGNYFSGHQKSKRCKRCRTTKYNNDYYNLLRKNIGKINENSLKRKKKKIDKIERFNVLMEKK